MKRHLILFLAVLTFSFNVIANDPPPEEGTAASIVKNKTEEQKNITEIEDITEDMFNRTIYSIVGDTIFKSTHSNDIKEGELTTQNIKPFTDISSKVSYFIFTFLAAVFVLIALVFLSSYIYNITNTAQEKGNVGDQNQNSIPLNVISIGLVFVLVLPVPIKKDSNYYFASLITYIASYITLKSNDYSNIMIKSLNEVNNQNIPDIKLPSFNHTMQHIGYRAIDFTNCLYENENLNYEQKVAVKDNNLIVSYFSNSCSLNLSFSLDKESRDKINNNEILRDYFKNKNKPKLNLIDKDNYDAYDNYANILANNYIEIMDRILEKAIKTSQIILVPNKQTIYRTIDEAIEDSRFQSFIVAGNMSYENNCERLFELTPDQTITDFDRLLITDYAAKCISFEINKSLILPNGITDYHSFNSNKALYSDNYMPLCSGDYGNNRYGESLITTINLEGLNKCLIKECGTITNSLKSNAYGCSSMITLFDKYETNKNIANKGFMLWSAYLYSNNTAFNNVSSRSILNDIKIISDKNGLKDVEGQSKKFSIQTIQTNNTVLKGIARTLREEGINETFTRFKYRNEFISDLIVVRNESKSNSNLFSRLANCIKSPMLEANGFKCGSISQEYHKFANSIIMAYASTRAAEIAVRLVAKRQVDRRNLLTNISAKATNALNRKLIGVMVGTTLLTQADEIVNSITDNPNQFLNVDMFEAENYEFTSMMMNGKFDFTENSPLIALSSLYLATAYADQLHYDPQKKQGIFLFGVIKKMYGMLFSLAIIMLVIIAIPFILSVYKLVSILFEIFTIIFLSGIKAIGLLKVSKKIDNQGFKDLLAHFVIMFYRIPVFTAAIYISYLMLNVMMPVVFNIVDVSAVLASNNGFVLSMMSGIIFVIVNMFLYVFIFWKIQNNVFSMLGMIDNQLLTIFGEKDFKEATPEQNPIEDAKNIAASVAVR